MTLMDRARRFMGAKSRVLALTAVPLASLVLIAAPAKADTLQFVTGECVVFTGGPVSVTPGVCTSSENPSQGGANGIKLFGTNTIQSASGGASSITYDLFGFASGSFNGFIPLSWAFNASTTSSSLLSYTLDFYFQSGSFHASESGCIANCGVGTITSNVSSGPAPNAVAGADSIALNGFISDYEIVLTLSQDLGFGDSLTLDVPSNSVDINGPAATAPEPASFYVAGSGLAALMLSRFRRKKA